MKKIVLITGAKGLIAKRLSDILNKKYSVRFLTRMKTNDNEFVWNIESGFIDKNALKDVSHIIHLAGAGIADKRWSNNRKDIIKSSRIDSAKLILQTLKANSIKIHSFISASAVGYYGAETTENIYTENNERGTDYLSNVCFEWEQIAKLFTINEISNRTVILRIGIVLSKNGGALMKMTKPIKYYIGSPLGTGKQYMPWIHIEDLCSIIEYSINNKISGIYNAVSPQYISNNEFTKTIAEIIRKPIIFPNVPKFIIKVLFGEMSSIILEGNRISSDKIKKVGYKFKFTNLKTALNDLLN